MRETRFTSAGYFLTRRCARPEWAHGAPDLLPPTLVTLSPCLVDVVPSLWPSPCAPPLRPDEAALARLGMTSASAGAAEAWATARCDAAPDQWPTPLTTLSTLREFVDRFVAPSADVILVGVALPDDLVAGVLALPGSVASERGHALRMSTPPEPGGEVAGYEVLGDGIDELHSIVCTGGEAVLREVLGIALNQHGLIDGLDDARRAAAWASEEGHGEPVAYLPWRVALYPRA
jgi:hypothetical protein